MEAPEDGQPKRPDFMGASGALKVASMLGFWFLLLE
jgi:hypothetical protein